MASDISMLNWQFQDIPLEILPRNSLHSACGTVYSFNLSNLGQQHWHLFSFFCLHFFLYCLHLYQFVANDPYLEKKFTMHQYLSGLEGKKQYKNSMNDIPLVQGLVTWIFSKMNPLLKLLSTYLPLACLDLQIWLLCCVYSRSLTPKTFEIQLSALQLNNAILISLLIPTHL